MAARIIRTFSVINVLLLLLFLVEVLPIIAEDNNSSPRSDKSFFSSSSLDRERGDAKGCAIELRVIDARRKNSDSNKMSDSGTKGIDSREFNHQSAKVSPVASAESRDLKSFSRSLRQMEFSDIAENQSMNKQVSYTDEALFRFRVADEQDHTVSIIPIQMQHGLVSFSVTWLDSHGDEVLASRMRANNGKPLSFGAEHNPTLSTVLRIVFNCN